MIPHITDAIQDWIERVSEVPVDGRNLPADVCVIELGGVVGNLVLYLYGCSIPTLYLNILPQRFYYLHKFQVILNLCHSWRLCGSSSFELVCQNYLFCSIVEEASLFTYELFAGAENFCLGHVSLVPVLGVVGEQV